MKVLLLEEVREFVVKFEVNQIVPSARLLAAVAAPGADHFGWIFGLLTNQNARSITGRHSRELWAVCGRIS